MSKSKNHGGGAADAPAAERAVKPTVVKKVVMQLKCILTDEELLECGQRMADANTMLGRLEREMESVKATYKAEVAEQEAIVQKNGSLIGLKFEHRDVSVGVVSDYGAETVTVIRNDTGEVVETRRMTEQELSELPMDDGQEGGAE